jgi:hypothetical protein
MEIFISWSGERSKAAAEALRNWLPDVIQLLKPWMSDSDIESGSRWLKEVSGRLQNINFGIICLTPENYQKPWILFEAGALSKSLDSALVCPILLDMDFSALKGPLAQFQALQFKKSDLLKLLKTINGKTEKAMTERKLEEAFEVWWPKLEAQIKQIPKPKSPVETSRTQKDILQEILSIVRRIDRIDFGKDPVRGKDIRRALTGLLTRKDLTRQTKHRFLKEQSKQLKILESILELSEEQQKQIFDMINSGASVWYLDDLLSEIKNT